MTEHTVKWDPVWDTLRMALCVLLLVSQIAILIKEGGWEWAAAITIIVFVGMAS